MSENAQFQEELVPLFLSFDALDLFPVLNLVLFSYALLTFAPRWKHTESLTLIVPCFHSLIYISSLVTSVLAMNGEVDFFTFQGVVEAFKNPNMVFTGWTHYLVFDLLVSRMIVQDSIHRGASLLKHVMVVIPCVLGTFMVGPTGWLSYMLLKELLLPTNQTGKNSSDSYKAKVF